MTHRLPLPDFLKPFGYKSLYRDIKERKNCFESNIRGGSTIVYKDGRVDDFYGKSHIGADDRLHSVIPQQYSQQQYYANLLVWCQSLPTSFSDKPQPDMSLPFMVLFSRPKIAFHEHGGYTINSISMSICWKEGLERKVPIGSSVNASHMTHTNGIWSRNSAPAHLVMSDATVHNGILIFDQINPTHTLPGELLKKINRGDIDLFGKDFWNGDSEAELEYLLWSSQRIPEWS